MLSITTLLYIQLLIRRIRTLAWPVAIREKFITDLSLRTRVQAQKASNEGSRCQKKTALVLYLVQILIRRVLYASIWGCECLQAELLSVRVW